MDTLILPPSDDSGKSSSGPAPAALPHLLPQHLADLRRSGLTDEYIAASGCFRSATDQAKIAKCLRWKAPPTGAGFGPCLAIAFVNPDGKPNGYWRFKPDIPRIRNEKLAKYESPISKGDPAFGNRAFFPLHSRAVLSDATTPLVITEGEKKSAAADQAGFPCIGLTGTWNWTAKRKDKDAERELIPDLQAVSWKDRSVFICFDSDIAEKESVALAELHLCQTLADRGALVKVMRLPPGTDGAKCGLDDYLAAHGADNFRALLAAAQPAPESPASEAAKVLQLLSEMAKNDPVAAVDAALQSQSLSALALLSKIRPGELEGFYRLLTREGKVKTKDIDALRRAVGATIRARRDRQQTEAGAAVENEADDSTGKVQTCSGYVVKDGMICRVIVVKNKPTYEPLCNFAAAITEERLHDDGVEHSTFFVLEGKVCAGSTLPKIEVPASEFEKLAWVTSEWGSAPIIEAARGVRDQLRAAILNLSTGKVVKRKVYTYLGWCKEGDDWFYLHAGGAICEDGLLETIETSPPEPLAKFVLPAPPTREVLKAAVRASLGLLSGLAPDSIAFPILLAPYRAVLGDCDFSIHVVGATGVFKSELAALAQQHHGAGLDARNFPGSWTSTANSLEGLAFAAKDAVLVVDDFAPGGSISEVQRVHREADRLIRAQGNKAGRGRMRTDGTLRPAKPPRGLILSTGEDTPRGSSLRSRMLVVEASKNDVKANRLTECQRDGAAGLYAQALAGFIRWLAPQYGDVSGRLRKEQVDLREEAASSEQHARTPALVAGLGVGLRYLLDFAKAVGAISEEESANLWRRGQSALYDAAEEQATHIATAEPATHFLRLVSSALASGRAHLASKTGEPPADAKSWGWRTLDKVNGGDGVPMPQGRRLGWLDGDHICLEPEAAFAQAHVLATEQGETLATSLTTTLKRLREQNLIQTEVRGGKTRYRLRRQMEGRQRDVIIIALGKFQAASCCEEEDVVEAAKEDGFTEEKCPSNEKSAQNGHFQKTQCPSGNGVSATTYARNGHNGHLLGNERERDTHARNVFVDPLKDDDWGGA